jgi:hypothetical protein
MGCSMMRPREPFPPSESPAAGSPSGGVGPSGGRLESVAKKTPFDCCKAATTGRGKPARYRASVAQRVKTWSIPFLTPGSNPTGEKTSELRSCKITTCETIFPQSRDRRSRSHKPPISPRRTRTGEKSRGHWPRLYGEPGNSATSSPVWPRTSPATAASSVSGRALTQDSAGGRATVWIWTSLIRPPPATMSPRRRA